MSAWTLKAARDHVWAVDDRRAYLARLSRSIAKTGDHIIGEGPADPSTEHLRATLALVDRMRPYLAHLKTCPMTAPWASENFGPCTCGLDALLREIDGGGTR